MRYSLEPPRRDLICHYTFDDLDNDRAVDASPQRTGGGEVTFRDTGVIGMAADMNTQNREVAMQPLDDWLPLDELAVAAWAIPNTDADHPWYVLASLTDEDDATYQLSYQPSRAYDEWLFAMVTTDGVTARLYAAFADEEIALVDSFRGMNGPIHDVELEFLSQSSSRVDEVRVYRRDTPREWAERLHTMGSELTYLDEFAEEWDNDGIPLWADNRQLGGTLVEPFADTARQLDHVVESLHVGTAAGQQLDRIGDRIGVRRHENEDDASYRLRIIGRFIAGRSNGTWSDLLAATITLLQTDGSRVDVEPTITPAVARVSVFTEDLDSSDVSGTDLVNVLKDTVAASHDIEVEQRNEDPFTVIDDAMSNDPDRGLTSDTTPDGGGLVTDV